MRGMHVCPVCRRTRNRNDGKTRRVGKTGEFTIYRKCLYCNVRFQEEATADYRKVPGFPLPDPQQEVVLVASGNPARMDRFIVTINEAYQEVATVPDIAFTGCQGFAKKAMERGEFLQHTGARLACFADAETVLNTGIWCIAEGIEIPGYFNRMHAGPLRHGGESGIAAFSWAARHTSRIRMCGFTRPYSEERWREVFGLARATGLTQIEFERCARLPEMWAG